jgi:hypothetical protein
MIERNPLNELDMRKNDDKQTASQLFSVARTKKQKVVMEVYGEDGIKVADYVDEGDKKLPYYKLHESGEL